MLAGYGATLLHALDFTAARTVALEALELARRAGAHTVEARVLAVLGFSSAFLDDAEAGSAAIDDAVAVAERTGEPEALGEAYLRRAELLTGPLNRLVEGVAYARDGVERMRALGLARTCGVALLTHAANALFRLGRWDEAERAVAEAWKLGPTGAAALDVRLARCRITLGRGRLDEAAADLEAVELLSRSTSGPRQRIPLLVLFAALELWRRDPARALRHAEDGLALAEAGAGDIWSLAPLVWHGTRAWADLVAAGGPAPAPAQVDRLRRHCAELSLRATTTVPAVRAVVDAFTLMCMAETARAEHRCVPEVWERAAGMWERHQQPYPAAYARLRHAEALLHRSPRSTAAADVLREAERAARQLGAQPLLRRRRRPRGAGPRAAHRGRAAPARGARGPHPAGRPHGPRARGPRRARQGLHQPGDRPAALHQREDRRRAPDPDLPQDRRAQPRAGQRRAPAVTSGARRPVTAAGPRRTACAARAAHVPGSGRCSRSGCP